MGDDLRAELDDADSCPEFLLVEGSGVARVGARRPCPAGRECGYRAVVFRTGAGCEYAGFLCAGQQQAGPCRPASWLAVTWPWRRRVRPRDRPGVRV